MFRSDETAPLIDVAAAGLVFAGVIAAVVTMSLLVWLTAGFAAAILLKLGGEVVAELREDRFIKAATIQLPPRRPSEMDS